MRVTVIFAGVPRILVDIVSQELAHDPDIEMCTLAEHETDVPSAAPMVVVAGSISPEVQRAIQRLDQHGAAKVIVVGDGLLAGELYEMRHRGSNVSPRQLAELVRTLAQGASAEAGVIDMKGSSTLLS